MLLFHNYKMYKQFTEMCVPSYTDELKNKLDEESQQTG